MKQIIIQELEAERLRRVENAIKSMTKSAQNKKSITSESITDHNVTTNSATSNSAKICNNAISKPNALEQSKKLQMETEDIVIIFCFYISFNFFFSNTNITKTIKITEI